jgi:hypothetical protein
MGAVRSLGHEFTPLAGKDRQCGFLLPDGHWCLLREPEHVFAGVGKPVHAIDTIPAVQAWDAMAAQVRDLLVRKAGYGNSWQHQGYMGNIGRILSKADRLKEMEWRDWDPARSNDHAAEEAITETLIDIAPLVAFALANIEEDNRWGR